MKSLGFFPDSERTTKTAGAKLHPSLTHVWDEVQKGVTTQCAHGQGNQEAQQELEEVVAHQGDEDDAQQRQQADDGNGDKAAHPGCKHTHRAAVSDTDSSEGSPRSARCLTDANASAAIARSAFAVVVVCAVMVAVVMMMMVVFGIWK